MSLDAFAKALAAFQAEVPAIGKDQTAKVKTKMGGEYSYSFTDLATIVGRVLPLLAKHGLSFMAQPTMSEYGFVLKYSLLHTEGHREDGFYPLPDPAQHGAQEIGSAVTYARRYSFCAATGIAPGGEDDDGAAAAPARAAARQQQPVAVDPMREAKAKVWAAAKKLHWSKADLDTDYSSQNGNKILGEATIAELVEYATILEGIARDAGVA